MTDLGGESLLHLPPWQYLVPVCQCGRRQHGSVFIAIGPEDPVVYIIPNATIEARRHLCPSTAFTTRTTLL